MEIRFEEERDKRAIAVVHKQAFGREAEGELVNQLRENARYAEHQSLVAEEFGMIVGHLLFSDLKLTDEGGRPLKAVALGPIAVRPERQRQGVGKALISSGLQTLKDSGCEVVVVLGEPEYYLQFGFSQELGQKIKCEYSGPSLMAIELVPDVLGQVLAAQATYPPEFAAL